MFRNNEDDTEQHRQHKAKLNTKRLGTRRGLFPANSKANARKPQLRRYKDILFRGDNHNIS